MCPERTHGTALCRPFKWGGRAASSSFPQSLSFGCVFQLPPELCDPSFSGVRPVMDNKQLVGNGFLHSVIVGVSHTVVILSERQRVEISVPRGYGFLGCTRNDIWGSRSAGNGFLHSLRSVEMTSFAELHQPSQNFRLSQKASQPDWWVSSSFCVESSSSPMRRKSNSMPT